VGWKTGASRASQLSSRVSQRALFSGEMDFKCAAKRGEEIHSLRNDGYEKIASSFETRHRGEMFSTGLGVLEQVCSSTCSLFVGDPA